MRKRLLGLFMALAVMLSMAPAAAFAADDAAAPKQMSSTSIGGVTYFYVNAAGDADDTAEWYIDVDVLQAMHPRPADLDLVGLVRSF